MATNTGPVSGFEATCNRPPPSTAPAPLPPPDPKTRSGFEIESPDQAEPFSPQEGVCLMPEAHSQRDGSNTWYHLAPNGQGGVNEVGAVCADAVGLPPPSPHRVRWVDSDFHRRDSQRQKNPPGESATPLCLTEPDGVGTFAGSKSGKNQKTRDFRPKEGVGSSFLSHHLCQKHVQNLGPVSC